MKPQKQLNYPVHELIEKRWSPRAFSDRPIDENSIMSLFEAARWAPSSYNEQPWRFIYATPADDGHHQITDGLMEGNYWAAQASLLIVTTVKINSGITGKPNTKAEHDLGLAVAQLSLQAISMDLYVHQMGGIYPDKLRQNLKIPETHKVVTVLAVGYLGETSKLNANMQEKENAPQVRKPLDEIVSQSKF